MSRFSSAMRRRFPGSLPAVPPLAPVTASALARLLAFFLLILAAAPPAAAQPPAPVEPELILADLIPVDEGGGEVTWNVGLPTEHKEPVDFRHMHARTTRSWRLGVERSVVFDEFGYSFFAYLQPRMRDGPILRYRIEARTAGVFRDRPAKVPFEVKWPAPDGSGERKEVGVVTIPVHDPAPDPMISAELQREGADPVPVHLGKTNDLRITLSNQLNAPVEVTAELSYDAETWDSLEVLWEDKLLKAGAENEPLTLRGEPRSLPALVRSILPQGDDPDKVLLDLRAVSLGRESKIIPVEVPVRFIPSLPLLVAILFLGVLLGCLTRQLFSPQPWRRWLRPFAGSCLLSLILWIAAIGLHTADSRLQLFGLEINPLDAVGVSLIGILVGFGGKRMVGWVEKRLGLDDISEDEEGEEGQEGPKPAGPAGEAA